MFKGFFEYWKYFFSTNNFTNGRVYYTIFQLHISMLSEIVKNKRNVRISQYFSITFVNFYQYIVIFFGTNFFFIVSTFCLSRIWVYLYIKPKHIVRPQCTSVYAQINIVKTHTPWQKNNYWKNLSWEHSDTALSRRYFTLKSFFPSHDSE